MFTLESVGKTLAQAARAGQGSTDNWLALIGDVIANVDYQATDAYAGAPLDGLPGSVSSAASYLVSVGVQGALVDLARLQPTVATAAVQAARVPGVLNATVAVNNVIGWYLANPGLDLIPSLLPMGASHCTPGCFVPVFMKGVCLWRLFRAYMSRG